MFDVVNDNQGLGFSIPVDWADIRREKKGTHKFRRGKIMASGRSESRLFT